MLLQTEDLDIVFKVMDQYKIKKEYVFQILQSLNSQIVKGLQAKHIINFTYTLTCGLDKKITKTFVDAIYHAYIKDINKTINENKDRIIHDHLIKYDVLIEHFLQDPDCHPKMFLKLKIDGLMSCLDTMKQKETLLGLHRKTMRLIINNKMKQQKLERENRLKKIDTSALTIEEKIRLNDLLEKARGYRIITEVDEYDSSLDVIAANVHTQDAIIIESPVGLITKTNEEKLKPQEPKKHMTTVQNTILQNFEALAKKRLQEAGVKFEGDAKS